VSRCIVSIRPDCYKISDRKKVKITKPQKNIKFLLRLYKNTFPVSHFITHSKRLRLGWEVSSIPYDLMKFY